MHAQAVVFEEPRRIALRPVALQCARGDATVEVECSGISTGTERLLYRGEMPPFPGLGYPLVPGYETIGRVVDPGAGELATGDLVFVPGASCFTDARGLFGGAAQRLHVRPERLTRVPESMGDQSVLLALAATAQHALALVDGAVELIVGHGILGRLLARLAVAAGHRPVVWEKNARRMGGAVDYRVCNADEDERAQYRTIVDVSGDAAMVEPLLRRMERGGQLVLAGFYDRIQFAFPLAFMKEARLQAASEWRPADLAAVLELCTSGALSLEGLVTHRRPVRDAAAAYATAFEDPDCLKMLIDWRS